MPDWLILKVPLITAGYTNNSLLQGAKLITHNMQHFCNKRAYLNYIVFFELLSAF